MQVVISSEVEKSSNASFKVSQRDSFGFATPLSG
jgi:hypothetical protein